jgi:hypothetical protein
MAYLLSLGSLGSLGSLRSLLGAAFVLLRTFSVRPHGSSTLPQEVLASTAFGEILARVVPPLEKSDLHRKAQYCVPRVGLSFLRRAVQVSASIGIATSTLAAQTPTVIHGRVEDSFSGEPVRGARVFLRDASDRVLTDSAGNFTIQLGPDDEPALRVERIGYRSQQFSLPLGFRNRIAVLRLEPAAVELAGVTVEVATLSAAIATLDRNLERRRNGYPGPMRAFDREWLDRFGPVGGSAWDVVKQRMPMIFTCSADSQQLCVRGRARSFRNPFPELQLLVCIDGWRSIGAISELNMLAVDAVALVETFSRSRINVFTQQWMVTRANRGHTTVVPLIMGCDSW